MIQSVSLIIVTDHRLFGECLASVLARCESFTVLAVGQTAEEALQQIQEHQTDIVLIDVHLPHTMVLTLTQQLTRDFPHVRVLLLGVTEAETEIVHSALRADFGNIRPFFRGRPAVRLMYRCPV